jgi:hypothetical protein
MSSPHRSDHNHLLAALPRADFERIAPNLQLVPLQLGEMVYEPGGQLQRSEEHTSELQSL